MALWVLPVLLVAWFSWRYAWWRPTTDLHYPRILMYHMITEPVASARFNGLRVSPPMFEQQLHWLKANGWQSFTVSELIDRAKDMPEKSFAITFDDGYSDNVTNALPLLQRYGFKATLYLVVDRHNRDWSRARKAHHDDDELKGIEKLSDEQVDVLLASGCFELAAHTLTHPNFLDTEDAVLQVELVEAKARLEQRFNVSVRSFAYPFGLYRPEHVVLVREAGYDSAVTVREGIDHPDNWSPLELARVKISGRDSMRAFRQRMRAGKRGV
ncbi:Polysaccharide deacetylase [hydrothermal vent metagenome]|uniref:Polysaccharide deacetylase n=1 Tax=hydrothermal vent metagenome TaxID=652676 RepID=A0A3B0YDN4_9ZZZZ